MYTWRRALTKYVLFRFVTSNTKIHKHHEWNCFKIKYSLLSYRKGKTYVGSHLILLPSSQNRMAPYFAGVLLRTCSHVQWKKHWCLKVDWHLWTTVSLHPSIIYTASRWTKVCQRYELKDTTLLCMILRWDRTFV